MRAAITVAGRVPADELSPATREGLLAAFRGWRAA
jgi:hypothetical protein